MELLMEPQKGLWKELPTTLKMVAEMEKWLAVTCLPEMAQKMSTQ